MGVGHSLLAVGYSRVQGEMPFWKDFLGELSFATVSHKRDYGVDSGRSAICRLLIVERRFFPFDRSDESDRSCPPSVLSLGPHAGRGDAQHPLCHR